MPHDAFYQTRQWREARAKQLRRERWCGFCAMLGMRTIATEVDHRLAIEKGGLPFHPQNLRSLCKTHHSQKTFKLDVGRAAAGVKLVITGPDGWPVHVEGNRNGNAKK